MVSWDGLSDLGLRVRPIVAWPGPMTPEGARRRSPFSAPFSSTVQILSREMRQLNAHDAFLQLAIQEYDLRNDGYPKARANASHPGAVVTFRARALRGHPQLNYATDLFYSWQENLRGIALGMEAQRLLKRYGIAQNDQQYTGYRAIAAVSQQTPEEARRLLAGMVPGGGGASDQKLFRAAAKLAQHDEGQQNAVMNAGRVLGVIT